MGGLGWARATLLMKVAPEVNVYVARVFEWQHSAKCSIPSETINKNIIQVCFLSSLLQTLVFTSYRQFVMPLISGRWI